MSKIVAQGFVLEYNFNNKKGGYLSPAKIFGIVVRSFGLFLLVYSVWYLLYGIATIAGLQGEAAKYKIEFFISGGFLLLIFINFLKGAPQLVKFCYPAENCNFRRKIKGADPYIAPILPILPYILTPIFPYILKSSSATIPSTTI